MDAEELTPEVLARNRLTELLAELERGGLTQQQVASRVGLPPQYLSNIKHGHRPMSELVARRLATEFDCSYRWLLGTSEQKHQPLGSLGEKTAVRLAVLPYPIVGEPHLDPAWDGSLLELAGAAAAQASVTQQPYILHFGRDDIRGRLRHGDLLLMSQAESPLAEILVVRHRGKLLLARKREEGYERLAGNPQKPTRLEDSCPVVGHCVGIVWAPLCVRT